MGLRLVNWILIPIVLLSLCCSNQALVSDGEVLLKFKASIKDKDGILRTWGSSGKDPCDGQINCSGCVEVVMFSTWEGVRCSNPSGTGWEVSYLSLTHFALVSSDVSALSNLTKLQTLQLEEKFSGPLPDISKLEGLRNLSLSNNRFSGLLPRLFPMNLTRVNLRNNSLRGAIRETNLFDLHLLRSLDLSSNNLSGNVSGKDLFASFQSLKRLNLSRNRLSGDVGEANLFKLQALRKLDLSHNLFTGRLRDMSGLVNMTDLHLSQSGFEGPLPSAITANRTSLEIALEVLDLSFNRFILEPRWIEEVLKLPSLKRLQLSGNHVNPSSLPNLTSLNTANTQCQAIKSLKSLGLSSLGLTGSIPLRFTNREIFPNLKKIDLGNNSLEGSVPPWFWYLENLDIIISGNQFSGELLSVPPVLLYTQPFRGNEALCLAGPRPNEGTFVRKCHGWRLWKIILVSAVCAVSLGASCLLLGIMWRMRIEAEQRKQDAELIALLLDRDTTTLMSYRDLKKATNDFADENLIGAGGFGNVYKGILADGLEVAIKRSHHDGSSSQDKYQFLNEVKILTQVHHRNLVRLLGCCLGQNNNALLVFEFVPNGTLQEHLNVVDKHPPLSWNQRLLIANQTAEALDYLHTSANPPIFHLDVKSANILLDGQLNAKVADFGISRLAPTPNATHITTMHGFQGTFGYMDPELVMRSQLTGKSDVYAFGAVLLEVITAKHVVDRTRGEDVSLIKWAGSLIKGGRMAEVIDPAILDTYCTPDGKESIDAVAELALSCLSFRSEDRPSMKLVSSGILAIRQKELYFDLDLDSLSHHSPKSIPRNIEMVEMSWIAER